MYVLRWSFLSACLGCVVIVVWNGRWEGRLTGGSHTWIVDLRRAPVWAPPPDPPYARFREDFKGSEDFPADGTPGLTIRSVLKLDWMTNDLLLHLWSVTAASVLLYLALRGERRDLILHLGLWAGIGLTAAATACIGLWLMFGGWGPPAPEFFGALGLVVGVIVGLGVFKRGRAEENPSRERQRAEQPTR
jgi:hypothetical protein